ncbi:MAG: hypothetical protein WBE92_01220 [Steroidobacteraceae bacterium]
MRFRLKAFGFHLLGSASVLTLVLGGLYLGWYRWPGWYLTGVRHIAALVVSIDLALGPLMTLVIASPAKPGRALARDICVIVAVQLAALTYGSATLWRGRPLYYAFSAVTGLQMVQAVDLTPSQVALGRRDNPSLAPTWHSPTRWVLAPLPENKQAREQAIQSMIASRVELVQMPRYFRPWNQGFSMLRKRLSLVSNQTTFTKAERQALETKMRRRGLEPDRPDTLLLTGRGTPLLAVLDPGTLQIKAILAPD